jgi:hypothetical protein
MNTAHLFAQAFRIDPAETTRIYSQEGDLFEQLVGLYLLIELIEVVRVQKILERHGVEV